MELDTFSSETNSPGIQQKGEQLTTTDALVQLALFLIPAVLLCLIDPSAEDNRN